MSTTIRPNVPASSVAPINVSLPAAPTKPEPKQVLVAPDLPPAQASTTQNVLPGANVSGAAESDGGLQTQMAVNMFTKTVKTLAGAKIDSGTMTRFTEAFAREVSAIDVASIPAHEIDGAFHKARSRATNATMTAEQKTALKAQLSQVDRDKVMDSPVAKLEGDFDAAWADHYIDPQEEAALKAQFDALSPGQQQAFLERHNASTFDDAVSRANAVGKHFDQFMTALSNMMKKKSDTSEDIARNMK